MCCSYCVILLHLQYGCSAFPQCHVLAEAIAWLWLQRIKERRLTGWRSSPVSGDCAVILVLQGNVPLHIVPIRLSTSLAAAVRACENICWQCTIYLNSWFFFFWRWMMALHWNVHTFIRDSILLQLAESICLCCFWPLGTSSFWFPRNQHSCFYGHTVNPSKELMWLNFLSPGNALFSWLAPDLDPQAAAQGTMSWQKWQP